MNVIGGDLSTSTPEYLSVEGWKNCLQLTWSEDKSFTSYCMPASRGQSCDSNAWQLLETKFKGDPCPKTLGVPKK